MPILKRKQDEKKTDFISRFMSDEDMKKEYPDEKQRLAVAYSQIEKQNNLSLEELADKYEVPVKTLQDQLLKGIEVEKEHTDDENIAKKIAMDHLQELPDYYDRLAKMEKKNAKQMPKIYYCRHIEKGVTGYEDETILVDDEALKSMDSTMAGIPVRVLHVDDIDVSKIQEESDGFVSESFYLECDGWHWAKFIAVSDECHNAIQRGWSVSNAYVPTEWGSGGEHHNIKFDRKILSGKYTHLAIVPNPRYEGAMILTPEEFKEYKEKKEFQLKELKNQKQGRNVMLKFFKKVPVENEIDENAMVQLENGKEVSLKEMIETVKNAKKNEKEEEQKINMDSEIEVGEEKMPLKELVNRYVKMTKKNEDDEKKEDEEKKNQEEKEKKENEDDDKEKEEKKNAKKNEDFKAIENAGKQDEIQNAVLETSFDKLKRGQERYGK